MLKKIQGMQLKNVCIQEQLSPAFYAYELNFHHKFSVRHPGH
jgi:hypothetical protein